MNWTGNIGAPKKYIVVSAHYEGGKYTLKAGKVSAAGETLEAFGTYAEPEEMVKHLGKEHPYWLQLEGTGVLTRLVETDADYKRDLILNADPEEFYFTAVHSESKGVVSFVRTSVAQELIATLEEQKIYLVGVSCGFAPLTMLAETDGMLELDYRLEVRKGHFLQLDRNKEQSSRMIFEGVYRDTHELLALALAKGGCFQRLKQGEEQRVIQAHVFTERLNEYREYRKFKFFGIAGVSLILVLLLGNYFYLNSLNQEIADKEAELALSNSNLSILNQLEQEEIRKQQLVVNSGVSSNHFIAFYLDEIGKSVPKQIRLSEMVVFPLKEKLKDKRKVEVDQKKIEVSGWTSDNVILDDWIEDMDKAAWVQSIELLNYQKMANNDAGFKLIILLAE